MKVTISCCGFSEDVDIDVARLWNRSSVINPDPYQDFACSLVTTAFTKVTKQVATTTHAR